MLFLGTEKYPDEGGYAQFLTSNGGYDNAYTASENTNYFFTVNSEKLEEALDRFSQFFISPLFNESAVDRERMAVNSEYEKDKGVPGWHFYLLMKHVADPRSVFSRYNCSPCGGIAMLLFQQIMIVSVHGTVCACLS